jgi:hypothetical protein
VIRLEKKNGHRLQPVAVWIEARCAKPVVVAHPERDNLD